jgi:hypothetical protein
MTEIDHIITLIRAFTGFRGEITAESTLVQDLDIWGDDLVEFFEAYLIEFNVDMSSYRWYFHTREEVSPHLGSIFFKPPNKRVPQIPITVSMLKDFADSGKWSVQYPEHTLPKYRIDIILDWIILVALFIGCLAWVMSNR